MPLNANLFQLGSSIQKYAGSRGQFIQMGKVVDKIFFLNFKSDHIYMKDAECVETNEKSVFQYFWFLVCEIWLFLYS